jgi:hypothetical protein
LQSEYFIHPPAYNSISGIFPLKPTDEKKPTPSIVVDPPQRSSPQLPSQPLFRLSPQLPKSKSQPKVKPVKSTSELGRPRAKSDTGINNPYNPYFQLALTTRNREQNFAPNSGFLSAYSSSTLAPTSTFFSTSRFELNPNIQPSNNSYYVNAQNVYVYPSASPPQQQPPYSPPQARPLVYKSSAWSLRESAVGLLMDIVKPETRCVHNIRHFKGHPPCAWGCCWHIGCM